MHGIDHHPGIGQIKRSGAQQAEQKAPAVAAHRQTAVFGIQPFKSVAIALEQQRREAEQLDLLDIAFVGKQCFDVILPTGFRRAAGEQPKCIAGKMRFGKKYRQRTHHQDQQRPRRKMHQQHGETYQGNKVLQQAQ